MPPLDPAAWQAALRRRAGGESIAALARDLGMARSTLRDKLAAHDIVTPPVAQAKTRKPAKSSKAAGRKPQPSRRTAAAQSATKRTAAAPTRRRTTPALGVRRQLIGRLYRAIDTKLKLMEARMNNEIDALDAAGGNAARGEDGTARTSADHERETRAFGALVKTINSVRQMQAELDTLANAHTATAAASPADARLAADADRYRRDIAQRLAKFVQPRP